MSSSFGGGARRPRVSVSTGPSRLQNTALLPMSRPNWGWELLERIKGALCDRDTAGTGEQGEESIVHGFQIHRFPGSVGRGPAVGRQPTRPNCILQQRHQRLRPLAPAKPECTPRTPAPLWGCGSGIADRPRGDSSPDPDGRCLRKCPLQWNPRADRIVIRRGLERMENGMVGSTVILLP